MANLNQQEPLSATTSQSSAAAKMAAHSGWARFKAGIALRNSRGNFLLIKEASAPSSDNPEESDGKWKLPYSQLREQDNYLDAFAGAASYHGTRLTGYDFDLHDICYIGFSRDDPSLVVIYSADQPYDVSLTDQPDPEETDSVAWFARDEILRLNEAGLLRDPEVTLAAIDNAQNGLTAPTEIITTYPSKCDTLRA